MTTQRASCLTILLLALMLFAVGCDGNQPAPATATPQPTATPRPTATPTMTPTTAPQEREPRQPLLMAHYMPWHQTPSGHGYWGYHWTMNHFDPSKETPAGQQEIASHYYPLTGPYDSSDGALLEYQVLLMKLSGIDGVIVDWYGMEDFWDYGTLNESTHALFDYVKKAGLQFSICYEDQTIKHMADNDHLALKDVYTHGQAVMQYLHDNWFTDGANLRIEGRPVLFIFGPQ